ncbi:30S ribosomal protein S24e [Thermofilum pendens]|uniref:Small ribosomal subunit protein eS24 n=1 Tax=Thermofilum pendens (strain DSM 2475 / Hrk 5) TaxID=368408 RepID=A1RXC7_THEPD|nr:30S ribosomal protein S24e [Thermofilum pendens]ABL77857.1 SSU ribosomal protein S24E [Thermofilum pendens Hrk 5]
MAVSSLRIIQEKVNKLVGRRELLVEIHHQGSGTPSRRDVAEALRNMLGTGGSAIVVRKLVTRYGQGVSEALIHIYDSDVKMKMFEPKHILRRNGLIQEQEAKKQEG